MVFGLLSTGFNPKRQEDVEQGINDNIDAAPALGSNFDTEAESPMGQLVIINAGAIAEVWAAIENIARSILQATGVQLDDFVQLLRLTRNPATKTALEIAPATGTPNPLNLNGTPTTIIADASVVTLGDTGECFLISGPVTIGAGGNVDADAFAEDTGPIQALAGSTWNIATPIAGWDGATNASDANVGQNVETDGKLRARALQVLTAAGGTAVEQIAAAILRLLNVTEVVVIENDSSSPDADGRPAHSLELVARGGVDQLILDTLFTVKPAGIEAVSSVAPSFQVPGTVIDANGDNKALIFSRPEVVPVFLDLDYTPKAGAPIDIEAQMLQAVLDFDAGLKTGTGVVPDDVRAAVLCAFLPEQVFDVLTIRMGLTANPPVAATVPTSKTQLAEFDSSRITITRIP